ncbi:replication initiation protein RepE [Photobacterium sagamiensis]|uniref:replication initiation protein RepE n=1 Tax=Photobacterium sagamiensis TaxID=2910241 RepID=UPI003D13F4A6
MSALAKKSDIVIHQANALTSAAYNLTRNEKRFVYIALDNIINKRIQCNEFGQYPVEINHAEYASTFEDDSKNISQDILKVTASLNKKEVIFYQPEEDDKKNALDAISWTTKRSYRAKLGATTVFFNAELVNIITKVDTNFTRFLMGEAGRLTSPYAMRLYESLRQWPDQQSITLEVDWMIERYELPESYRRMSDFRRRFLKPAVREINEHTSITIDYEEVADKTRSNRIAAITFNYSHRKEKATHS